MAPARNFWNVAQNKNSETQIPRSEDEKKITLHEPPVASISLEKLE